MVAICKASKLREPSCQFSAARRIFLLLGLGLLFLGYGTGKSVYVKLYALACILVAAMSGMGDMSYLTGRKSRAGWTSNQNHTFRFDLFICAEIFCFLAGIAVFVMIGLDVFALSLMLILINTSEYANIFMNARCFYKSLTDGGAFPDFAGRRHE